MTTYNQNLKHKHKRLRKHHKAKSVALKKCPQKKGLCMRIIKESPKKPNSANRSVAKIRLSTGKRIRAQIPGEKHSLIKFNRVLVRGGRARDLPGVRYRVIRGKYDCSPVVERRKGISKYGVKSKSIITLFKKSIENYIKK